MRELVLDVSRWDAGIDLQAWRDAHDLWGVIVKATGSDQGRYVDSQFAANYDKAVATGLHVGAYCYSAATDTDEARQDAQHMLQAMGGRSFDLPIYIDVEEQSQARLGKRALTDVVLAFIDEIESAGHIGGVYTSGSWWQSNVYADELRPYANWIAWWTSNKPNVIADVGLWQFGSMRLSDGDIRHDDVSGYVDANYCYVDYPAQHKNGGGSMAKLSYAMAAAETCDHFIDHPVHGYSQINRDGTGEVETITLSDGTQVSFQSGDRDCSRLMQTCYVVVGALPRGMHMWTGNEREILLDNGFVEVSLDEVQRGDVLWRTGHTEMYLGNGIQGGARQSEYGTIDGQTGDQTGEEIARSAYDRWEWESAYRCVKERPGEREQPKPAPKPHQEPGNAKNDAGLKYQGHSQDIGWLPEVRDGQTAGTVGYGKRLEAIRFTSIPASWSISAKAHIANIGWRDFGTVKAGDVIGTTGKACAIESLIVDAVAPNGDRRKLHYQVHQENVGWKGITPEGFASGTDGMGLRLEAVRIWLA